MNIELYISKGYRIILACEGKIKEVIESVYMNKDTRLLFLNLKNHKEPVELNCPIDSKIIPLIENEKFCAFGFFEKGKLLEAQYVPFSTDKK